MNIPQQHFEFDLAVYRLSAIKKAAYRYMDRCGVAIEPAGDNRVRVSFALLSKSPVDLGTFTNEVLDQDLRELVAEETKSIRDVLLAQAFSGLALLDPVGEQADFRDDPLGIATTTRGASHDAR